MLETILGKPRRQAAIWGDERLWPSSFMGYGRKTQAGPVVDQETALMFDACWCATRVLAETMAMIPFPLMRMNKDGGSKHATDDKRYPLTTIAPNERMGITAFWECMNKHQVNHGNAFAEIERTFNGDVANLWPIHPSRIKPVDRPVTDESGNEYGPGDYLVRNKNGTWTPIAWADMLHIPGALSDDGVWGKGIIDYAKESIGLGLATEKHGSTFFASGGQPLGIIIDPSLRDPDARKNFRQEWKEIHSPRDGGNAAELAIIAGKDAKYQPITGSNTEGQFNETMEAVVPKIARWYRIPPHILYDLMRSTNNNIEHQGREFVLLSLRPWWGKQHDEMGIKLLTREERNTLYYTHDYDDLISGDRKSRAEADAIELRCGKKSINEIRKRDGEPGIGPAGDQYYVMTNMTTAEKLAENPPAPSQPGGGFADTQDDEEPTDAKASLQIELARVKAELAGSVRGRIGDTLHRMFSREANAVLGRIEKETDLATWLDEFHGKHEPLLSAALATAMAAAGQVGLATGHEALAAAVVLRSQEKLVTAFENGTIGAIKLTLETWADSRTAEELTQLFNGAKHAA